MKSASPARSRKGFHRLVLAAALFVLPASPAVAVTVATFAVAERGVPLTITNEQAAPVSGRIRLLPRDGRTDAAPVSFLLPPGGAQTFDAVVAGGGNRAVLVVESSDVVRVSTSTLRLAHVGRPATVAVRHTAQSTGAVVLGLLRADVVVRIFANASSSAPLAQATFTSGETEQMIEAAYAQLLPVGTSVPDGYVTIEVLRGQATIYAANAPPGRVRAVRMRGVAAPLLSVRGGDSCEFRSGFSVVSSHATAAASRWAVYGGTAIGSVDAPELQLALGTRGYATAVLTSTISGSAVNAEANIRTDGIAVSTPDLREDVLLGAMVSARWSVDGDVTAQEVCDSDEFGCRAIAATARSYSYPAGRLGAHTFTVKAHGACGTATSSGRFRVSAIPPQIVSFVADPATVPDGYQTTLSAEIRNADRWELRIVEGTGGFSKPPDSAGYGQVNGFISLKVSVGGPPRTRVELRAFGAGGAVVVRTVDITIIPELIVRSFAADSYIVPVGGTTTLRLNIENAASYRFFSSRGNCVSPASATGSGERTATYSRCAAPGADVITVEVTGLDGQVVRRDLPRPID